MIYLASGLVALGLCLLLAQLIINASPANLAKILRYVVAVGLLVISALLAITGRLFLAIPAFGLAIAVLRPASSLFGVGSANKTKGQRSQVRAAMVEMELDHDSGDMDGTILTGDLAGCELNHLSQDELKKFWLETEQDNQSRQLIEAYLDRRFASWREDFQANGAQGQRSSASSGPMTNEEAYQVLGLSPNAGDTEIRAAHRRLMKGIHPDRGGSSFLAAKINEAKDTLLRRH